MRRWIERAGVAGFSLASLASSLLFACVGDDPVPPTNVVNNNNTDAAAPVDSGGGGGADVQGPADTGADAPPGFGPADLGANVVVWLDASEEPSVVTTAGLVGSWLDRSAAKNNAKQTNSMYQPSLSKALVNGHDAVHFSITGGTCRHLEILDAMSLHWDNSDFTIEVVAKYRNDPMATTALPKDSQAIFWSKQVPTADKAGIRLIGNPPSDFTQQLTSAYGEVFRAYDQSTLGAVSTATNLNDGNFHIFGLRLVGTHLLEIRVDGKASANANVSAATVDSPNIPVSIGGGPTNEYCVDGDIAEVVGYKGALSDTNIVKLEGYFKTKYAL